MPSWLVIWYVWLCFSTPMFQHTLPNPKNTNDSTSYNSQKKVTKVCLQIDVSQSMVIVAFGVNYLSTKWLSFDTKTGIHYLVSTMAPHALVPWVARSSVTVVLSLTMQGKSPLRGFGEKLTILWDSVMWDHLSARDHDWQGKPQYYSLVPGKFEWNFRLVIFKQILVIDGWGISCEIALIWMSLDFTSWSHYLSQCWPRSLSPYGVTRPHWDNSFALWRCDCNFEFS